MTSSWIAEHPERLALAALLAAACALCLVGRLRGRAWPRRPDWLALRDLVQAAWRRTPPAHRRALGIITAVALADRLLCLGRPMEYDEAFTYLHYASQPLRIALSDYSFPNNHVFHSLLVALTTRAFGNAPWAIRLPAFTAGLLLIPAAYAAGRTLYGRNAALLGAALVATAPALIQYSTDGRGYSLICLFTCLMIPLGRPALVSGNPAARLLLTLLAALGFWTVPIMLYPFGALALWLLLCLRTETVGEARQTALRWWAAWVAAALVLTLVLYLPVVLVSGVGPLIGNQFVRAQAGAAFWSGLVACGRSVARQWSGGVPAAVNLVLLAGFLGSQVLHARISRVRAPLFLVVAVWTPAVILLQRAVPPERVLLYLLPLYLLGAAAGIAGLLAPRAQRDSGRAGAGFAPLAVTVCLLLSVTTLTFPALRDTHASGSLGDAERLTADLSRTLTAGDRVVAVFPADTYFQYYFLRQHLPAAYLDRDLSQAPRAFVVVMKTVPQTPAEVLTHRALSPADWTPPRLLADYPSAAVYEIDRRAGGG